jgi:hypothetical protein
VNHKLTSDRYKRDMYNLTIPQGVVLTDASVVDFLTKLDQENLSDKILTITLESPCKTSTGALFQDHLPNLSSVKYVDVIYK